ncbi:hypothetical protein [Pseudorhodoferax sp. Leaf265]|uniref:hypothetical protein n=1 Tax=Pseudorhodoferax sp. Leaf265 TaxID=1736315 RepID=UPI0006FB93B3|nr:hypothetical protein [Pseudorhodoferax sp. Leaf265]KQP12036.1 hypothetical protein ASF45_32020 [Pseudorhodoferax sp. Leaf265]
MTIKTLKVPVALYELRKRRTVKAALNASAARIHEWFEANDTLVKCDFAQLVAWTIDTGYGAGYDQTACLEMKTTEQKQLRRYLRGRLTLLMKLLKIEDSNLRLREFTKFLESTERGDASFVLGGLACRIACEKWFRLRGSKVKRFWHLSVYASPASRWISAAPKNPQNRSRPDYLVQDTSRQWFPAEAKGTFGELNWATIKTGLTQASRLKSVTFMDPAGATLTTQSVKDFACVMGHFGGDAFVASLVDPAPDDDAPLHLELLPDFGDAHAFLGAIQQYRVLGHQRRSMDPPGLSNFFGYEARYLGRDPFFGEPLVIGVPYVLLESEEQLRAFMVVARHFAAVYGEYFSQGANGGPFDHDARWAELVVAQSAESAFDVEYLQDGSVRRQAQRMFASAVEALKQPAPRDREGAVEVGWIAAMSGLAKVPLFWTSDGHVSLEAWLTRLRNTIASSDLASRLGTSLDGRSDGQAAGVSVATALNGLIVVHGAAPRQVRREARKSKI